MTATTRGSPVGGNDNQCQTPNGQSQPPFQQNQASWTNASKKQREKLLELIRRLAEDDKDGVMADKVLNLLWNLAHRDDVPVDIMELALSAHIKILDYSCSQDRDTQKIQWIDHFIEELHTNDKWVIPALKQIREICSLFGEAPQNLSSVRCLLILLTSRFSQTQRSAHVFYRHDLINQLQHNHSLVTLVAENLATYMNTTQLYARGKHEFCHIDIFKLKLISFIFKNNFSKLRAFCGKHLSLIVQFPNHGRQIDDMDIWSHTNDTVGLVRRCILNYIKANVAHAKIELFVGGADRKLIGQLNLKDKSVISAKLTQVSSSMTSSPDSSDSSTESTGNRCNQYSDSPNPEVESCLPGVIMSQHPRYISFLWQVADLGSNLKMPPLRTGARVLMKLMLPDSKTIEKLAICLDHAKPEENNLGPSLDSLFFGPSASRVLYLTEVIYVLMPAGSSLGDDSADFQFHFLKSGGLSIVLNMLTTNNFLPNTDMETQRCVYLNGLKIAKLFLTAIGYGLVSVAEACQPTVVDGTDPLTPINQVIRNQAEVLQNALQSIPNPSSECMLRNVSIHLAQQISDEIGPPGVLLEYRIITKGDDSLMYYCPCGTRYRSTMTTCETLTEWEYLPPVGPRPPKGFVGLKNAGATCYMNSVIQQLYMIPSIRNSILAIEGTDSGIDDNMFSDEKQDIESNVDPRDDVFGYPHQFEYKAALSKTEDRKEYNIGVLRHLQVIFGHLAASQLQYYVPREFWKQFRLWGEPVNLRQQHDALEFFNSLVDSLDEALKALGHPVMLSQVLGGSFADQICQGCPHRYEYEESFTILNVDIRNHQNLLDSLEQYIKCDLLEGANAYHCEKCDKKVDTVKRLLIKKLKNPPVLAIQLKRFDYDWERECAIKFNDYFEFPRELDMELYTVPGVAKVERANGKSDSQLIMQNVQLESETAESIKYRLVGVLVPSGQASGGHYYSYIIQRNGKDGKRNRWYKFDDGDVTECKMDDDEEMKNQCFGGEYMGEIFDHMMKRMSYRRQKRWWNSYILFYERMDTVDKDKEMIRYVSGLTITRPHQIMSPAIERSVWKQNVQFMHYMQYSLEYFQFMKKLLTCNGIYLSPVSGQDQLLPEAEEITTITIQLAARFLFTTGFHTKKIVRGPASDWYDVLCILLRHSKNVHFWFAHNVLFNVSNRFSEYLLECPSAEVRGAFAKLTVFLAHFSLQDGPCSSSFSFPGPSSKACDNISLSDHLLRAVLNLLRREVSEHGHHLQQYFNLFVMYANLGMAEKTQLLKLSVPATFMLVSLDEGPGPPIKYAELGKLYSVVSQLIRCCNVLIMQSSINGNPPLPNPNLSQPIMPIQQNVADILFGRTSYVKKIIEDYSNSDETIKFLRFCCWENPQFSSTVLSELLWQVAYSYTYELRPYLDLFLQILLIEDSWQTHRIHSTLKGIPDDRDGLFDTIQRSKNHYQKRAYQCIKCMVALFNSCPVGYQILQNNGDLKRKWTWAVEWLGDELERRPYTGNTQYTYNNWSPVQSNETSNGYFLERSHSARMTLAKACELCAEEEPDDQDATDEHESSLPDVPLHAHSSGSHYPNNHVHGEPYTGPAAYHLNNHQKSVQRAQVNDEGNEEVSSLQMWDQ
ncbi:LOW QUALITY PROTEIN: ubiquitin carboxyl-terminal hydrolase 9X-like [Molossus nigricans]